MHSRLKLGFLGGYLLLFISCSCSQDISQDISFFAIDAACFAESLTAKVPDRVPLELLPEDADPEVASQKPNSLRDVPIGTVMDELQDLDGCWAHQYFDEEIEYRDVMKFDMAQNRMTYYRVFYAPMYPDDYPLPNSLKTDLSMFFAENWEVTLTADNMFRLNRADAEGAAFNDNGETSFYCAAGDGSFEDTLFAFATLDGDSLKYLESYKEIVPGSLNYEGAAGYWVRFECP